MYFSNNSSTSPDISRLLIVLIIFGCWKVFHANSGQRERDEGYFKRVTVTFKIYLQKSFGLFNTSEEGKNFA